MAYYVYRDANGQWRWYLKSANGRKLADSGEGYHNRQDCLTAIQLVSTTGGSPVYQL